MSNPGAEAVLRLSLQFLDVSRDVDRNIDDSQFREEGGEIVYVFDANLFEVFMRPFDPRGQSSSLHALRAGAPMASDKRDSLAAQTALLTSEFLLSGELPGQKQGKIYLSEWHSWEFARRVRTLVREQGQALDAAREEGPIEKLTRIVADNRAEIGWEEQVRRIERQDPILAADLRDIQERRPLDSDDWRAFVSNREVLEVLATDKSIEPAEQLGRLLGAPMRRRLHLLHKDFPPPDNQLRAIHEDANRWMRRLVDACAARGISVVEETQWDERRSRRRGALWDDAQTVALTRWAAAHGTRAGQRLVLITADNLLFDVYREWYADLHPQDPEYTEPFILRRLLQYAPIFNLADSRNSLGDDVRAFFRQLQNIIEVTLLPVNLARQGRPESSQVAITRMREKSALRLLEDRPISEDIAYLPLCHAIEREGVERRRGQLDMLVDEWRRLERTTLGVADDYVRLRLREIEQHVPELMVGHVSQAAITNYIEGLIVKLYTGSLALWLPLARDVVLDWKPIAPGRRRVPIAFRLYLGGEQVIDLGGAVDQRLSGEVETPLVEAVRWEQLQGQPQALFGLAACLALASEDWGNADHFSEMALRSPPGPEFSIDWGTADELHELKYLNALTRRFRIGAIGPARNTDALSKINRAAKEANELLGSCVQYHSRSEGGLIQPLRLMRALSERAALNLFHAATLIPAVRTASLEPGQIDRTEAGFAADVASENRSEAARSLARAEQDLLACFDLAAEVCIEEPSRRAFQKRLFEQYSDNTAAACTLRWLMYSDDPQAVSPFPDHVLGEVADEIQSWMLESSRARSQALTAELLAFLVLRGDEKALGRLRELGLERFTGSLPLDAALFAALSRDRANLIRLGRQRTMVAVP